MGTEAARILAAIVRKAAAGAMKPLRPAMHPRHEADLRHPAEMLRMAMLALILRQRRRRAEQMRLLK